MANTYTQLYVHIVFSVEGRQALIPECHKTELRKYITGILTHKKQKLIQINSMPDHIHILGWCDSRYCAVWFGERYYSRFRNYLYTRIGHANCEGTWHRLTAYATSVNIFLGFYYKVNSTRFINQKRWTVGQFAWQAGFGAFSYSHSQIPEVAAYIENQEKHHSRRTFREEYLAFLERFGVAYDVKYVFDSVADLPSEE